MGGATVVLVESCLQDLMWHMVRVRCPPEIQSHARARMQRLMSDVALAEQLRSQEAEETSEQFAEQIVYDILDDVLHTKVPFVEVSNLQREVDRVAYSNEVLKLRVAEKEDLDQLRQMALDRKSDALVYTAHKYFEEVFMLRKERAKLTALLREAQHKIRKIERGGAASPVTPSMANAPGDFSTINLGLTQTFASGLLGAVLDRVGEQQQQQQQQSAFDVFEGTFNINNNNSLIEAFNNTQQQQQQPQKHSSYVQRTLDHMKQEHVSPKADTMAIFSYDELAVRMMLNDPDLAQMKIQNVKLCRDAEEMRLTMAKQKNELVNSYETKIRQLEMRLRLATGENDGNQVTVAKVARSLLIPLHGAVKSAKEGFQRSRETIQDALTSFGELVATAKIGVFIAIEQVERNESMCLQQVQCAADYIEVLCSGEEEQNDDADALTAKTTTTDAANDQKGEAATAAVSKESMRQHFEACLEIGPFDDAHNARSKRYWQQHELTAYIRSSIFSISKSVGQFRELLRRLNLLSNYATKERAAQACHELQQRKASKEPKTGGGGSGVFGQPAVDDSNKTLVALSAAARVSSTPKLFWRLFATARAEAEQDDDNNNHEEEDEEDEESSGVMSRKDRAMALAAEREIRRNIRENVVVARFRRAAERLRRARMLRVYDSFREFVGVAVDDAEERESLPHSWTPTGPFTDIASFEAWRAQLAHRGRLQDDASRLRIATARERTKTLVTELVSKLPASLLALFVANPDCKPYSWSDPFGSGGAAGDCYYFDGDAPYGIDVDDWNRRSGGAGMTMSAAAGGRRTSGSQNQKQHQQHRAGPTPAPPPLGARRRLEGNTAVECPHCHLMVPVGGGGLVSRLNPRNIDGTLRRKPPRHHGDDAEASGRESPSTSTTGSAAATSPRPRSAASSTRSGSVSTAAATSQHHHHHNQQKKVLRFSPHVHEVPPDEMIPVEQAALPNRHGFFAPAPPSHFATTHYGGMQHGGANGGALDGSPVPRPPTPGATTATSPAERAMQIIRDAPIPPSILRGSEQYLRQHRRFSVQLDPHQRQPEQTSEAAASSISSGTLLGGTATVTANLATVRGSIPVDDDDESGVSDDKLILVRRLRGLVSPPPCIVSTVGLAGSLEMAERSMQVSAQQAARQFVGRTLLSASMLRSLPVPSTSSAGSMNGMVSVTLSSSSQHHHPSASPQPELAPETVSLTMMAGKGRER